MLCHVSTENPCCSDCCLTPDNAGPYVESKGNLFHADKCS